MVNRSRGRVRLLRSSMWSCRLLFNQTSQPPTRGPLLLRIQHESRSIAGGWIFFGRRRIAAARR